MINIPVVFCFDSRIILGASVAIKSLIDCAKENTVYDIRVFHSDLELKHQKALTSLLQNTRHNIAFHYISPDTFKGAPHNNGSWTELVYYRLLIPEILSEYDKVIYSDVDVLFKGDLQELYLTDISSFELGAVRAENNKYPTICHKYFKENTKKYIYWSGLLLFNCERYRNSNLLNILVSNAKKYYNELKFFDLDLINITCQNIFTLDLKYCVLQSLYYKQKEDSKYLNDVYTEQEINDSVLNPIIIHYAGKLGKPWRMNKPYADYKKYIDSLPKELRVYTFRDIRKKLFNKK